MCSLQTPLDTRSTSAATPTGVIVSESFLQRNVDEIIETVHKWSKYESHAPSVLLLLYIESILVMRVPAVLTASKNERNTASARSTVP